MESKTAESNELVKSLVKHIAKMAIPVFNSLDLKTHIESMVIDYDTKEEYVITINKVSNGQLFKGGEIVFTKKQRDDFANQEAQRVLSELKAKSKELEKEEDVKDSDKDSCINFGYNNAVSDFNHLIDELLTKYQK